MKCFFRLKKPSNFFILEISITSDINLPFLPICLFLKYAVCCEDIKSIKISLKELLILFLDLHLIKIWVYSFYESPVFFFLLT